MSRALGERLARLTPSQRALLELRLRQGAAPEVGEPATLSYAQERMWFLHQLEPLVPVYNMGFAVRLRGPLDPAALESSFQRLVDRHRALRTLMRVAPDGPQAVVVDRTPPLERADLPGEQDLEARISQEIGRPFDLARDLMLRGALWRLAERDHVLVLTLHHGAGDEWSIKILGRELAELYSASREGRPAALPALPLEYSDYAARERERLEGPELAPLLDYWRRALDGLPPQLELPMRPGARPSSWGRLHRFTVPAALAAAADRLAQELGATSFMTALAVYQLLLARYSGQDDVCVGVPVDNRDDPDLEPLVGVFVNSLPLRADLTGDPSFRELLAQVRDVTLEGLTHRELPFAKLVAELESGRAPGRSTILQTMLSYHAGEAAPPAFAGLEAERLHAHHGTVKFGIQLSVWETREEREAVLIYDRELFEPATVARMADSFLTLLEGAVRDPARPVSALAIAPPEEARRLVARGAVRADPPACLHALVEAQVARTPEATAVRCGNESITYAELDRRANRLAARLQRLGVRPDAAVALYLERNIGMIVAALGVLKAGGAYVPLDPSYPADRLRFMLEDSGAVAIISQRLLGLSEPRSLGERFLSMPQVFLDDLADEPDAQPASRARPANLALILYTSGSTGRPKGVAIEHRNVANVIRWTTANYSAAELAGVLGSTSLSFDVSVSEIFGPLSAGGAVILVDSVLDAPDGPHWRDVTLISTVPSAMAALLADGRLPAAARTVALAGEKLEPALVDDLYRSGTVVRVCDLYGPTECAVASTCAERRPGEPATIGRLIANTRAYVLDRRLRPVPLGVPGELYLGGDGVARGYRARPALTAERFVPNPFPEHSGERLYRTGDRARLDANGSLEYLGRLDQQVKLRGFRIELGEIEQVLTEHAAVRRAAVRLEGESVSQHLTAYCEAAPADDSLVQELEALVAQKLPEHMLPSRYLVAERLPRTANGKLDRRALAAPAEGER